MSVTTSTTVRRLLDDYPYLREWLIDYAPAFKKLTDPVLYATVARAATIEAAASMAEVPVDTLLDHIRTRIAEHEIAAAESGARTPATLADSEERMKRQEALKAIIRKLHDGASVDAVKAEFDEIAADVDSAEIAAMEQALIAEGMPAEEIQRLCDVHVAVFKDTLEGESTAVPEPGHPVAAYVAENERAREIVDRLRQVVTDLADRLNSGDPTQSERAMIAADLEQLAGIETHYTRKENQLFPALERHGIEGPTKVMWGIHDEIRRALKSARSHTSDPSDAETLSREVPELLLKIEDMIYKEERILFPTALDALGIDEWQEIARGDAEIGYAWIEAPGPWTPSEPCAEEAEEAPPARADEPVGVTEGAGARATASAPPADDANVALTTGRLTVERLDLLFRSLPFDLTYVDEHGRVLFYSEGERVFPRSPAVIGREVRNCHPPKSVDKVEQILAAFRAGEKDVAEFWIELEGRFVHIRYFALRDADGEYRGCLEVVQDATHVRSLVGERRLLDW